MLSDSKKLIVFKKYCWDPPPTPMINTKCYNQLMTAGLGGPSLSENVKSSKYNGKNAL